MSQPGPEQIYKDKLAQGRFEIQKCAGCARHVFYPRVVCPHCGSDRLEWVAPGGAGVVYSTTVVRRKPDAGGDYNVALIDLAEGPRMMSRVVGLEPGAVKIGMKVKARVVGPSGSAASVNGGGSAASVNGGGSAASANGDAALVEFTPD